MRLRVYLARLGHASGSDLSVGVKGEGIKLLQAFLVSKGAGAAAAELGKAGATGFFGRLTEAALAEYQKSVGIKATGYFGPLTRKYIAEKELEAISP